MEDLTGKQLGQYRVIEPLGEGGMAAVYKAYDPVLDRYVALKVLARHFTRDPQFTGRFQQEAKLIAKLQHVHILPVHDYGQEDDYTFIVMPFVETGTLSDLLDDHALPLEDILRIISQVGDALAYAHERGIVHRDVKPSNILIDDRGNCLLTDFGIAKIVEATIQFTQTGAIIGTPAYMSPEQIRGEPLDGRSDLYSLGIILFELATGRRPYRAETPPAVFVKHLHDPLPMPRELNPDIPEAVERVILKALAKDREHRYPTAGALVKALSDAISEIRPSPGVPADTELDGVPPIGATSVDLAPSPPSKREQAGPPRDRKAEAPASPRSRALPWGWILGGIAALVGVAVLGGIGLFAINALGGLLPRPSPTGPMTAAATATVVSSTATVASSAATIPPATATMLPPSPSPSSPPLASLPRAYGFSVCPDRCTGSNATRTFPERTTRIYAQWEFEGIPVGADYTRVWTMDGREWVRYHCTWPGPVAGTDMVTLRESGGFHSGTWEFTLAADGVVLIRERFTVEGNWDYWAPAGTFEKCY